MSFTLSHSLLNTTLGAIFLGGMGSGVLFGLTTVQTYLYFKHAQMDTITLKVVISILWVLNALHLAFTVHALYFYGITNYANPISLLSPVWSIVVGIENTPAQNLLSDDPKQAVIIVNVMAYLIIILVYSWRIWIISGKTWSIIAIPILCGLLSCVFGIAIVVESFELKGFASLHSVQWMLYSSYGTAVVSDAYIALTLCFYLKRGRSGVKATNSIVNVLILYCTSTGALACSMHICNLVTYATMSDNFIYIGVYVMATGLYTNALLASLNAREALRSRVVVQTLLPLSASSSTSTGEFQDILSTRVTAEFLTSIPTAEESPKTRPITTTA